MWGEFFKELTKNLIGGLLIGAVALAAILFLYELARGFLGFV